MAERISGKNFEEKVIGNENFVLVDFYSDSCVPCKMLSPVLGDLEDDTEGSLPVYKVNVSYDGELAEKYEVKGTPTLLLFEKGQIKDRRAGAVKKDELYDWIAGLTGLEI